MRVLRQLCLVVAFAGGWPAAAVADSQCTFAPDCAPGGYTPPYETVTETPVSVATCQPAGTAITTPTFGPYSIPAECPAQCGRPESYDCSYETPCNCDEEGNNCSTCTVPQTCSHCVTYSIRLACTGSLRIVYEGVCGGGNWVWSRSSAEVGAWSYTCPTSC